MTTIKSMKLEALLSKAKKELINRFESDKKFTWKDYEVLLDSQIRIAWEEAWDRGYKLGTKEMKEDILEDMRFNKDCGVCMSNREEFKQLSQKEEVKND